LQDIFYVYIHRRQSDNTVFYVGKGKKDRAWDRKKRNRFWNSTVEKHGITVEIIFDKLDEDTAFQCEIDTILEFKYFGHKLCNMTNGGEGSSGFNHSTETKLLIAEKHKGRPRTAEWLQNQSNALRGIKRTPSQIEAIRQRKLGVKHSEETRKLMSEISRKGQWFSDKNQYVFFTKDDILIGTRDDLSRYTGIPKKSFSSMFGKQSYKVVQGWSILKYNSLLIFKENIKCQS
jgi:NUMOD3 motif